MTPYNSRLHHLHRQADVALAASSKVLAAAAIIPAPTVSLNVFVVYYY